VSHCPYCGKSLLPFFKRLWFWLIVVILVGAATVALVLFFSPSVEDSEPPPEIPVPTVTGAPEGTSVTDLAMEKTVNCNGLLVSIIDRSQDLIASDGSPITAIKVHFLNEGSSEAMLYSTQWQLETVGGTRVDCYIGKTDTGESVRSDLDSASLPNGASLTVTLYFAAADPAKLIFAPNALAYSEESLVTWLLGEPESGEGDVANDAESTTPE
jgi:hypothetical protein